MTQETTWEYHTLRPPRGSARAEAEDPIDELNELGDEGWELVCAVDYTGGGTKYLVFKRPKADAESESGPGRETHA
ncbi:DUF4177 domain-containing protein [Halogeometricum limi]|uniref:DUF4177 domain-containing protein n=1 Tax=Halogeometricum limi TaxID=555875 RepID=A0A1I6HBR3_9EURY|nr:DUF4177 domain-containing protein [Halogeometricum limi]SFR51912.1 hypothetical protein SAMN04488124_2030 [Halogeometricum limi]